MRMACGATNCAPGDGVAQYDIYPNPSARSRDEIPYVVDVQSDLLAELRTRLVMPLSRTGASLSRAISDSTNEHVAKLQQMPVFPWFKHFRCGTVWKSAALSG